jgi:hypothetical protein
MPVPPDDEAAPRRISLPAWLLSLAVHLAVAVLGALLMQGERPREKVEADRPVAIVLARRTADRTDYFSDDEPACGRAEQWAGSTGYSSASAGPISASPPLVPGISLPERQSGLTRTEVSDGLVEGLVSGGLRGRPRVPGNVDEAAIYAEDKSIPWVEPTGPKADVSLFGGPAAVGRSFVFVIDRSASMGASGLGAIQAAAEELGSQIGRLTDEQTFQVVAYNQAALYFTDRELIPATRENQKKLVRFVANLAVYGETQHLRGLIAALRLKPEVIYLLTDGDPELNASDLALIREQAAGRTSIHCLHFGRGRPQSSPHSFERLANENRGSYLYVDLNQR